MKKFWLFFSLLTCIILLTWCNNKEGSSTIWNENTLSKNVDENWWFYLTESECYDDNWKLNDNPELDDAWNIINCYNSRGNLEWKQIIHYYDWPIWLEQNFKNWKHDWVFIEYY